MAPTFVPRNRRPSRINHRAHLEASFRQKTPVMVPDGDTFYYDPAFISEWTMPADLWIRLPNELTTELRTWQAAGAAVLTVLTRYDKLEREGLSRGWPEHSNAHLSRTTSHASPVLNAGASPTFGSPLQEMVSVLQKLDTKPDRRSNKDTDTHAVIDTPPETPQVEASTNFPSFGSATEPSITTEADLDRVNSRLASMTYRSPPRQFAELSPSTSMSSRRSSAFSQTPVPATFDESAWDTYINACKAELDHLRGETLIRFRHLGHGINKLWNELRTDPSKHVLAGANMEFSAWWTRMSGKAKELESEAKALELPDLQEVRRGRLAHGLCI